MALLRGKDRCQYNFIKQYWDGCPCGGEMWNESIMNEDINPNAQIGFSKLFIESSDIVSINAYAGGTGVNIDTTTDPSKATISIGQEVETSSTPEFAGLEIKSVGNVTVDGIITATKFVGAVDASNMSERFKRR